MAQGKKTDSKTKAKVVKEKLSDIDKSTREIAEGKDMDHTTVAKILKEDLQQLPTQSKIIAEIIDNDREFIKLVSNMGHNKIREMFEQTAAGKSMDVNELDKIVGMAEKVFKRFTFLQGDITDDKGGLKENQLNLDNAGY